MRIRIEHETTYVYEEPARGLIQVVRLTPRSHVGQHVLRWRIEPSIDGTMRHGEDALGNTVYRFTAEAPADRLTVRVSGEVETDESHGVVRGSVERAPDLYWLRETTLTAGSSALLAFAHETTGAEADPLSRLHLLSAAIAERLAMERGPNDKAVGGARAFADGRGLPQDIAHAFVACARHFQIPARTVSGYFYGSDDEAVEGEARDEPGRDDARGHLHAWAEAKVDRLGWVAFDPSFGICVGPPYVRAAIGLDSQDCAPVRGARYGGGTEELSVRLSVTDVEAARGQSQSQSQS